MSKWEMVRLGDLFDIGSSKRVFQSEWKESGVPFYRAREIAKLAEDGYVDNELFIDENMYEEYSKKYGTPNAGDLMVTGVGTLGICYIVQDSDRFYFKDGNILWFRKTSDVSSKYISWVFRSNYMKEQIRRNSSGTTVGTFTISTAKSIEIPLPPLETQKQIAKTLDTALELINLRKKQLEELDNLIKTIFYDMFGDPVTNEKGWEDKKINDIANVETGATPSRNNTSYYNGVIPWVKTGEIDQGYIFTTVEYISEKAINETNCKVFPWNTILIAMYGQGKTRGQAGMLKIAAATNQACAAIIPSEYYISEFLYRLLIYKYEDLRELGRGGNQPNLKLSIVKNFRVIVPPKSLQEKFASMTSKIEEQKALVQKAIDESQYLFDSLMSKYFD